MQLRLLLFVVGVVLISRHVTVTHADAADGQLPSVRFEFINRVLGDSCDA